MPIDPKHKIVFVHIPKTGGGSIEKALGLYGYNNSGSNFICERIAYGYVPVTYENRNVYRAETKDSSISSHIKALKNSFNSSSKLVVPLQHESLYYLSNSYKIKHYFKFSFVRCPIDRLISAYQWLNIKNDINDFIQNDLLDMSKSNYYFISQFDMLKNSTGKIQLDFIGRFEALKSDFEKLQKLIGLQKRLELLHKSQTTTTSLKVSTNSRKIIEEIYYQDFQFFNY